MEPTSQTSSAPSPSPATVPAPLTGEPVPADVAERPVIAVKIDNSPAARPQVGLDAADVVVKVVVEGGITRFVALFHSELPGVVGPVRSARLVDVELLSPFIGVLAYSVARDEVSAALRRAPISLLVDDGEVRCTTALPTVRRPMTCSSRGRTCWPLPNSFLRPHRRPRRGCSRRHHRPAMSARRATRHTARD